jgi:hypothetical protein
MLKHSNYSFSGQNNKLGRWSFQVGLLDTSIAFSGFNEELNEKLKERYAPFLAESGRSLYNVAVFKGSDSYLEDSDGYLKLEETEVENERVLLSTDFAGTGLDESNSGKLFLSDENNITASLTAFENYFRWLIANLLIEKGGFVFHSAGIVKADSAYLFFGHSGAGKSTVSEFSRDGRLLSDDMVFVVPRGKGYSASTTPFFGVLPQHLKETSIYSVNGCYRLRKSNEIRTRQLSKAAAFGLLVPSCPNVLSPKRRNELLYPAVRKFLDIIPVYELFFRKDDSFWNAIMDNRIEGDEK